MADTAIQSVKDAWIDAFNKRDRERFTAAHAESVVFHDPTFPQPLLGRGALGTWFDGLFRMFPDCKLEASRVYGLEDWVCAECLESGTMKGPIKHPSGEVPPTGRRFGMDVVLVCRVEGGLITEVRDFYDVAGLMTQLGLQA